MRNTDRIQPELRRTPATHGFSGPDRQKRRACMRGRDRSSQRSSLIHGIIGQRGNLETNTLEEAYKVLEITPEATNEEVRAAYRRLALKHHPDKVAALGEDIHKAANEKFQRINDAKAKIYKARGMN